MKKAFVIAALLFPLTVFADGLVASVGSVEKARDLLKANKPEETLQVLTAYQPAGQELSLYHLLYAQALVQTKQLGESIEHFRIAYIYATTPTEKERALFERAETYRKMTYYSEAVVSYRNFLKFFPQSTFSVRVHLGLAQASYRTGRYHEAIEAYDKAGDTLQALAGKANALHALGKWQDAQDIYTMLLNKDKKFVEASQETLYNLGENFREMGRLLDAKIYLNSVRDRDLQLPVAAGLGLIAQKEKKYTLAVKFFTEALASPDRKLRLQVLLYLAQAYLAWEKPEEALPFLVQIRRDYPYGREYDTALLLLARLYRNQGKTGEAVALLNELVCRKTPMAEALDELESMVLSMKDKNSAELEKIWSVAGHWLLDPSRTPSIIKIARSLRHSGKPYLDICRWLIKNGSEETKAQGRLLLADFYADMGEAETASQYAERAIKKTRREDDILRTQARIFFVNGAYQEALKSLMSIIDIREADVLLLLDVARSLKDDEKALAFCETLFSTVTWSPTAQVMYADLLYDNEKKQDALKYYGAAAALKLDGRQNASMLADIEWACYRVSLLAHGQESIDALAKIQKIKNALGRLAGADLKSMAISERMP
jgi:tetratricopeptide (TPR) repeat protein